jgi:hypothetical protein
MGKWFDILWVGGQNTFGKGFNIPLVGGQDSIPTNGILNPLSMAYRTPYPWYIEHPTNGILNTIPMVY